MNYILQIIYKIFSYIIIIENNVGVHFLCFFKIYKNHTEAGSVIEGSDSLTKTKTDKCIS